MAAVKRGAGSLFLVCSFALLAGCEDSLPGKPNPADEIRRPDKVLDFAVLYKQNCAGCHGADGRLGPAPPLNDKLYLAITPDTELRRVIAEGRPDKSMPGFAGRQVADPAKPNQALVQAGALTDEQVNALVRGLRAWGKFDAPLSDRFAQGKAAGDAKEGAAVFKLACAGCHGEQGQGGKHDNREVGALNDPTFLALISDQTLRRYAITGRPDLGMPAYNEMAGRSPGFTPLDPKQIDDLVALLASWRPSKR